MSGTKIALLVLGLLALLFVGGVSLGSRSGTDPGSLGWIDSLSSTLTPSLDYSKIQGSCLDQQTKTFAILPSSPCVLSIPTFKSGTRKMSLTLTTGDQVDVQYVAAPGHEKIDPQDESSLQSVTLESPKAASLIILKEGELCPLFAKISRKRPVA